MISPDQQAGSDWRKARLRRHADYVRAYEAGRREQSPSMAYVCRLRGEQETLHKAAPATDAIRGVRVGLTVGKVLGPAVVRNRIKRRMREAVREHLALLPTGLDLVLLPRKSVATLPFDRLSQELATVFGKVAARVERVGATALFAEQAHRLANPTPRGPKRKPNKTKIASKPGLATQVGLRAENKAENKAENEARSGAESFGAKASS